MTQTPASAGRYSQFEFGRFPIGKISPVIEHGAYPAKATEGEAFPISARIYREGHDKVGATVVLTGPNGESHRQDMAQIWPEGLDIWETWVRLATLGDWQFHIEAWSDDWHTWVHNAEVKLPAGIDVELVCLEAQDLFSGAHAAALEAEDDDAAKAIAAASQQFTPEASYKIEQLVRIATDPGLDAVMVKYSRRPLATASPAYPVRVDRKRALFGSWFEFFPRSQGAVKDPVTGAWTSGGFAKCGPILEHVAALGFDVVYIPPIHPIGTQFRKGKNNSLNAGANEPGSPWAIGNVEGGHDAIHPDLGTIEDFDAFVAKANELGMEVALDFALQAAPDHPWVQSHPEFFTTRLDGTIAYAENPPKKYQDIYPINFDNSPATIYAEALRIINYWIDHGVTIFRVDNPHTKPLNFWAWLIAEVKVDHPEVLFFAEAFSRPEVMQTLGKAGFDMSYTYFTWRNTKKELGAYLTELATETDAFMRPNFFVNTPDINPLSVRSGSPAAFQIRAILATTMSPNWGIYQGFEQYEFEPLKAGGEEYLNSEKYEFRPRDFTAKPNMNPLLARLNQIRREHPALQQLRQVKILKTSHDDLFAFAKHDGDDTVIVVVNLNPHQSVEGQVVVDLSNWGIDTSFGVHDLLGEGSWFWGKDNFVRLSPEHPAHIFSIN